MGCTFLCESFEPHVHRMSSRLDKLRLGIGLGPVKACHASDWLVYLDQIHTCYNTIVWDPEPPRINLPLVKRAGTRATKQILNQVLSCQHPQYQNQSTRQARFQFHGSTCIMYERSWVCGLSTSHPWAAVQPLNLKPQQPKLILFGRTASYHPATAAGQLQGPW